MSDEFGKAVFRPAGQRVREDEDSRIGFEEWNLIDTDGIEDLVKKMLRAGFKLAEDEYECTAWFAVQYADGAETPPGSIVVQLPLGPDEDSGPQWMFSLYEMVKYMIDVNQDNDGTVVESSREYFEELRNEFRELADIIDSTLRGEKYVEK